VATYNFVARDLMAEKVVCVQPETSIREFIKVLVKNKINGAPVIDKAGKLVGVVSKTDIIEQGEKAGKKRSAQGKKSYYDDTNGKLKKYFDKVVKSKDFGETLVKDIMTTNVITARADDTIDRLAKIMYDKKIHRIIIQDKGKVLGVVSTMDILNAVSTMGYGSSAFVTEEAVIDLQDRLDDAAKSIQSLRGIISKIRGEQ
jgi:CBS domain-containing protein